MFYYLFDYLDQLDFPGGDVSVRDVPIGNGCGVLAADRYLRWQENH